MALITYPICEQALKVFESTKKSYNRTPNSVAKRTGLDKLQVSIAINQMFRCNILTRKITKGKGTEYFRLRNSLDCINDREHRDMVQAIFESFPDDEVSTIYIAMKTITPIKKTRLALKQLCELSVIQEVDEDVYALTNHFLAIGSLLSLIP
jgi:hypothetical protein